MNSELLNDVDLRTKTISKPASLWRNKWRALRLVLTSAGPIKPGTVLVSEETYPSREIAEQEALDAFEKMGVDVGLSEYIGPIPCDGARA